jgi:hypothetical protein
VSEGLEVARLFLEGEGGREGVVTGVARWQHACTTAVFLGNVIHAVLALMLLIW